MTETNGREIQGERKRREICEGEKVVTIEYS